MYNVVQYIKKSQKSAAIDLRRKGYSYSEIKKFVPVPKSTLSYWLKDLNLTAGQKKRLDKKRLQAAKAGSQKKILRTSQLIEMVRVSSAKDIRKISKRELWLMGIILYWRESNSGKGVHFTSSDPYIIKLFLKWLQEIGKIPNEEIGFDIFITVNKKEIINDVISYWAKITEFSKGAFSHVYFQKIRIKVRDKTRQRKVLKKSDFGLLRVRVRASSMLARQISGWITGIKKYYWNNS